MTELPSSRDILARLVAFDTVSHKSNLPLIHWVQRFLKEYGVSSTLLPDATGEKANLHAIIGPADVPGIILSGHTDVVPVEGQDWASDPFTLREHDGNYYGRGACDMKGFLACVLSRVPRLARAPLKKPVHLAFSYDEEVGCLGVRGFAPYLAALNARPEMCLVGEPSNMSLITGHKSVTRYVCTVRGREAHSSLAPYAPNAVEAAAELVAHIGAVARRLASEGPFNTQFDPPFASLMTGLIQGGAAVNIVPSRCEFSFEIRGLPEASAESLSEEIRQYAFKIIEPRMKDLDPTAGFEFKETVSTPGLDIGKDEPAVALIRALSGANEMKKVSFATEAGIFQAAGIPTVVCGPGSIEQAHKPNEYVAAAQITRCEGLLDRLTEHLCA